MSPMFSQGASILGVGFSFLSAAAQLQAGKVQQRAAETNAFNIETDKVLNKAAAVNAANQRKRQFEFAQSANIALLSAQGRDIGGADRSVEAFLRRNRETAFEDISAIADQEVIESYKIMQQAYAERARGRDAMRAARVGAFTTIASALLNYQSTLAPSGATGGSNLAPRTSPTPVMNPRR